MVNGLRHNHSYRWNNYNYNYDWDRLKDMSRVVDFKPDEEPTHTPSWESRWSSVNEKHLLSERQIYPDLTRGGSKKHIMSIVFRDGTWWMGA